MTILQELLEKVQKSEIVEQVRIICDKMMEEESISLEDKEYVPKGGNIFLTVKVPPVLSKNEIAFLTLEREFKDHFVACLYNSLSESKIRKIKSWEIKEAKPEKILTKYVEILNHLRGE